MILSALNDYYRRLAAQDKVPAPGFSSEKISYALVFSGDGTPLQIDDLRDTSGKKPRPRTLQVPYDKRKTSGLHAYPLWDKTSYVFGVTAGEGKKLAQEHAFFKQRQCELFGESNAPELRAFLKLLDKWHPGMLPKLAGYSEEVLDANFVFRLEGEHQYLHESKAAVKIWTSALDDNDGNVGQCLITGENAYLGTDHPPIKGVNGAQSSGASLISFNADAYSSYGFKEQKNASISKAGIFNYSTALNYLLRRDNDNHQRLQIGDATVVFWAEASDAAHAEAAEGFFAMLNEPPSDEQEAAKLGSLLGQVAQGRPLAELDPRLESGTRFFVLGLAPNAARLSVRFWCADTLDRLARHYAQHHRDLALEPTPWKGIAPGSGWLALQTAPMHGGQKPKADDVSPQLAGELMRSILTGRRYPQSLLSNLVMRFRNDGHITGARIALCKAVLAREARLAAHSNFHPQEVPVSLDRHSTHPGYLLGRLFAELENAQRGALGEKINATIRDRYYGAASATPASVFPMLLRNAQNHLSNMRKKDKGGLAHTIEKEIGAIIDGLGDTFPKHLKIEDQGRFAIGYYHQSQARYAKRDNAPTEKASAQGENA